MNYLTVKHLGRVSYKEGLRLQQATWQQRLDDQIDDTLLLLEHDNVFTIGRRDSQHNMLLPQQMLGAPLVRCDRGGEMTYHGPGQLVGYLHAKLSQLAANPDDGQQTKKGIGVKQFIYRMEEAIILLLRNSYGLKPQRDKEHRGVWLAAPSFQEFSLPFNQTADHPTKGLIHSSGKLASSCLAEQNIADNQTAARKIAALGISIKQGVSLHGFALNVTTDLSFFERIVPCGIAGRGVTSLQRELDSLLGADSPGQLSVAAVAEQLPQYFYAAFGYVAVKH